jgi:hypothetical protein
MGIFCRRVLKGGNNFWKRPLGRAIAHGFVRIQAFALNGMEFALLSGHRQRPQCPSAMGRDREQPEEYDMRIPEGFPITSAERSSCGTVSRKAAPSFQKLFDAACDAGAGENYPPSSVSPFAVSTPPCVDAVRPRAAAAGVQTMARFIDALEAYQRRLGNPRDQLRDIAPALERLELEHQQLSRLAEDAAVDEALQGIMKEGLVTSAIEIHRFRSGRYC